MLRMSSNILKEREREHGEKILKLLLKHSWKYN